MEIKDIEVRQGKIDVSGEIVSKEEPREFDKFGNKIRVCNCDFKDDSGNIKLTLWNDEVEKVNVGDIVKITNGYCNEYQGEKQLTAGKFGQLEIVKAEEVKND
ncbi:MAG: DNA-binding protein [Nanoarchaeota archaeon]|jgi:replication factor A1|nr:DNA-binding protein [Nanoarchaeota archaeon]|tara:strand:+ start:65731 stop:66039 length:309 start_codon:yes stop_codon:yes gene_type:complete